MKPISEMTDKEFDKYLKTIKPTLPPWCKDGAKCSHYSSEEFVDRNGNRAMVTIAYWTDKKGEKKESVSTVEWEVDK